ncbi:MAG: HPr family phosphocarrier protein [Candidatus Peribacteraceae bacterium]
MGKLQKLSIGFRTTGYGLHARTCLGISRLAQEIGKTTSVELITGNGQCVNAKNLLDMLKLGYPGERDFSLEIEVPDDQVQETEQMIRQRMEEILTSC